MFSNSQVFEGSFEAWQSRAMSSFQAVAQFKKSGNHVRVVVGGLAVFSLLAKLQRRTRATHATQVKSDENKDNE